MGAIGDELNHLRRGRGVMAGDLPERVGPALRVLSGIADSDSVHEVRRKLIALLDEVAIDLPGDLRLALSAGLALHEDVHHRFLEERMQWLAGKLRRDVRTARRRVDEAIRSVASLAAETTVFGDSHAPDGWYLGRFRVVLRLDAEQPTAIEERKIVSCGDRLSEVLVSTSVPRPRQGSNGQHGVDFAVIYGGSLERREQISETYFRYFIRLPRPLSRGESHDLGIALTIPPGQPMNPRYSFQPLRRCDEFDLRIRFGPAGSATRVWNMAGIPRGMADDFAAAAAIIDPDDAGEIHLMYQYLKVGLVYGARWEAQAMSVR